MRSLRKTSIKIKTGGAQKELFLDGERTAPFVLKFRLFFSTQSGAGWIKALFARLVTFNTILARELLQINISYKIGRISVRKIMVATHGYLADGIKSSIELLCGKKDNISYINAYVDTNNIDAEIGTFFNSLKAEDEAVIFTDILGGSVNQKFVPYCSRPDVYLISGFNLGIILEIVVREAPLSEADLHAMIENCRKQLVYIKELDKKSRPEEEFFA